MSTTEELRLELEAEWMAQDKILAWPNWLQDQLLKLRLENKAAYSQGYKDAREESAQVADYYANNSATARSITRGIRSLPIPERKK